jgi:hypothetical protein
MKNTVIIKFWGGLGNQMFQYCLLKRYETTYNVLADISEYSEYKMYNGFELEKIFDIQVKKCSNKEKNKLSNSGNFILKKIKRKIFGRKNFEICETEGEFCNEIFNLDPNKNYYIDGYWQDLRYFNEEESQIINYFNFTMIDEKNIDIIKKMNKHNSVSIHIRRGDYINNSIYEDICTLAYYNKAIEYIYNEVDKPIFYIFSNDIPWVKENFKNNNEFIYIDWNERENSYQDLLLMSNCKHNIIANSSFSWWGAFLNKNKDKIIITPSKWNNIITKNDMNTIIKDDWIKIDNTGVIR